MKLCFLEGDMSRSGGTERMTTLLANALSNENQVSVISLKLSEKKVFFELKKDVQHYVLKRCSGKFGVIQHIREIKRFVQKNKIECLINVDIGMSIYGIPAVFGTKTKVITWEHANFYNNWNSKIFPYFRMFAAKYSDIMVVLTEQDKKNYQTNIKFKTPIYAIANPVEKQNFYYNCQSKVILSVGMLSPIKGFSRVVSVAEKILLKHSEWRWIICGEGPEREHLQSLITSAHLDSQVFLLGKISDMDNYYQNASMFVMTSEMEGLPMVLLEAKSWGLPLISFDIMTGPNEVIKNDINGYLVEPYDIDKMAECIELLIENENLRKQFSSNSQLDMEHFDFENIIEKWTGIIKGE